MQTPSSDGVLPFQHLVKAVAEGIIRSPVFKIPDTSFQPASLDLRLGEKAYRLRCSFLPDKGTVKEKLGEFSLGEIDLTRGAILEQNRPYLIPLVEELRLPDWLGAKTNPKSSTGRLDIFARVITDYGQKFDEISNGYQGPLFLEVVSRSFTIMVNRLLPLNQLRLIKGKSICEDDEIKDEHRRNPIMYTQQVGSLAKPVPSDELPVQRGLFLGVDLSTNSEGHMRGYRAKKNSRLIDLGKEANYSPEEFWHEVKPEAKNRLVLEQEEFYILISQEGVSIPPDLAAEMTAYDPTSGEMRTHYAGFFDPGFGYDPQMLSHGAQAVMEVRAHDVPFVIEHGQRIAKLEFHRMVERPTTLYGSEELKSSYQFQRFMLSKHFLTPDAVKKGQLGLFGAGTKLR